MVVSRELASFDDGRVSVRIEWDDVTGSVLRVLCSSPRAARVWARVSDRVTGVSGEATFPGGSAEYLVAPGSLVRDPDGRRDRRLMFGFRYPA